MAYITGTSLSNNAIVFILYKNMQEFVIYEIIDMHLHCTVQPHASIANFPNLDFMLIFEKFRLF